MTRATSLLLLMLCCASPVLAGGLDAGDRELAVGVGFSDLDLDAVGPVDLGSADGSLGTASMGWYASRRSQLGVRLALIDLESDIGETIDGSTVGVFFGLHWPTNGIVHPFAAIGFALPSGNLGARYQTAYDVSAGVKLYPSERLGFSIVAEYRYFNGEEFVPDGTAQNITASFLFKF